MATCSIMPEGKLGTLKGMLCYSINLCEGQVTLVSFYLRNKIIYTVITIQRFACLKVCSLEIECSCVVGFQSLFNLKSLNFILKTNSVSHRKHIVANLINIEVLCCCQPPLDGLCLLVEHSHISAVFCVHKVRHRFTLQVVEIHKIHIITHRVKCIRFFHCLCRNQLNIFKDISKSCSKFCLAVTCGISVDFLGIFCGVNSGTAGNSISQPCFVSFCCVADYKTVSCAVNSCVSCIFSKIQIVGYTLNTNVNTNGKDIDP